MRYPLHIRPDGCFFLVTFPDIPEAITQGESYEEAIAAATDALETAFDLYSDNQSVFPLPSCIKSGEPFVELAI